MIFSISCLKMNIASTVDLLRLNHCCSLLILAWLHMSFEIMFVNNLRMTFRSLILRWYWKSNFWSTLNIETVMQDFHSFRCDDIILHNEFSVTSFASNFNNFVIFHFSLWFLSKSCSILTENLFIVVMLFVFDCIIRNRRVLIFGLLWFKTSMFEVCVPFSVANSFISFCKPWFTVVFLCLCCYFKFSHGLLRL